MEVQALIWAIWIALFCSTSSQELTTELPSCQDNNVGINFNATALSGYWYEAARAPKVDVLECLNVLVPAAIENNTFSLQLDYITTVTGGWEPTKESVQFPWTNSTQHGIFSLEYDQVTVTYKLAYTNYSDIAIVCGYSTISNIPLYKFFSRERQMSQEQIAFINVYIEKYGIADQIYWEEQSPAKCNGSALQAPLTILIGFIAILWGLGVVKGICI